MHHLLRQRETRLTFFTTLLFFVAFYTLIVPLPRYLTRIGLPDWQVGLVLGAFGLASLIGRPLAGLASDWWGRRSVVLVGTLLFVVGVLALEHTISPLLLLIARILQALGYVAVTTAATARITDHTPALEQASAIAAFGIAANIAMTLTPAIVDLLLRNNLIGLTGGFWLAALLAVGSLGLALCFREAPAMPSLQPASPDQLSKQSGKLWVLPAAIVRPWLAAAFMGAGFGAWLQYLPLLTERRQVEPTGILYALYGLAIIGTRLLAGPWLDRGRSRLLLSLGFALMTAGLLLFAFTHTLLPYLPATMLIAAGGGILHPLLMTQHVQLMPPALRGRAVATFYLGFDLGNGLGTWLLAPVLQGWGLTALFAAAALSTMLGLWVVWLPRRASKWLMLNGYR